ncbi:MAG: cysteine desulfurase [Lachnospiraceae bacterium]|nr:cysteine desulfurase [Lachnospiraceae bacterium]
MDIYLDNAATTRVCEEAAKAALEAMQTDYGNPSSKHIRGLDAEKLIKNAAKTIADTLDVKPGEIVFTSGGTESNNMALIGAALAAKRRGNHVIASGYEHASVYNTLLSLRDFGFEVEFAPVDELGHVKIPELLDMIRPTTVLVSVMYVNNEVGSVNDIASISQAVHGKGKDIVFHCDAVQAYGKYVISPVKLGIDLMSVSGHKITAPKGSGFLYVREGVRVRPLIWGGGQQKDRRSGTENVPAIAGLAAAARRYYNERREATERLYELKTRFVNELRSVDGAHVNAVKPEEDGSFSESEVRKTAPHIVSAAFEGTRAEVLLHALEESGIFVSSGSACSSNHPGISGTLRAIGVKKELLDSTLRFSFAFTTTSEELDETVRVLKQLVPFYARFARK